MTDDTKKEQKRNDLRSQLDRLGYGENRARPGKKQFSADDIRRAVRKQTRGMRGPSRPSPQPGSLSDGRAHGQGSPERAIAYRRDLPRRQAPRRAPSLADQGRMVVLEEAVGGSEVVHPRSGVSYLISTFVADLREDQHVNGAFKEKLLSDDPGLYSRIRRGNDIESIGLEEIVFLDLETTGLGNSPLFLIGTMIWEGDGFEVRQYLARNYAEESSAIALFLDACIGKRLLVSFNGKSYDLPFVRTRAAANGIPFTFAPAHLDLLHECRRVWKDSLPDCKLQTLERHVCNRVRYGDIPGSEIPDAYHAYVRTENARQIVEVLRHNVFDLITLADLMTKFPE